MEATVEGFGSGFWFLGLGTCWGPLAFGAMSSICLRHMVKL